MASARRSYGTDDGPSRRLYGPRSRLRRPRASGAPVADRLHPGIDGVHRAGRAPPSPRVRPPASFPRLAVVVGAFLRQERSGTPSRAQPPPTTSGAVRQPVSSERTHVISTAPSVPSTLPLPPVRLRLAPHGALPRRIDGMWWPYSRDLLTQLPKLLAALPSAWGDITGVTVDATAWSAAPGRMVVANQVVRLHKAPASPHAPDRVVLLSPGLGRWDLQVIPPEATKEAAALLTATALDDGRPGAGGEARSPAPTAAAGPRGQVGPAGRGTRAPRW
ncbi:DUF5994 family protein [Streptomyces sp. RM99]|uniref:DUF5994 family protein n=1 Tax=Streptomyces sp. RM99 TaxID=2824897 RepID=UPI0024955B23|nr:DUF5994 family protein [Streptomyces sp. RM99]